MLKVKGDINHHDFKIVYLHFVKSEVVNRVSETQQAGELSN